MAVDYAKEKKIPYKEFYPDYQKFPNRIAPLERNKDIINAGDQVLAIWNGESSGTRNSIGLAYNANKIVTVKLHGANLSLFRQSEKRFSLEILGDRAGPGEMKDFRTFKNEFYKGNISLGELEIKAIELYSGISQKINNLPLNALLIEMPSGSGRNIIPKELFKEIKKHRHDLNIINDEDSWFIRVLSVLESKTKSRYDQRINDLKNFEIINNKFYAAAKASQNNYIIDDVLSTGDTAVLLKRILEKNGVKVNGIIAGKTNEVKTTSARDMERIYARLVTTQHPKYLPKGTELQKVIVDNFTGFPRRKATNFEIDLFRNKYLLEPGFAVKYLEKTSSLYRALKIDYDSLAHNLGEKEDQSYKRKR